MNLSGLYEHLDEIDRRIIIYCNDYCVCCDHALIPFLDAREIYKCLKEALKKRDIDIFKPRYDNQYKRIERILYLMSRL